MPPAGIYPTLLALRQARRYILHSIYPEPKKRTGILSRSTTALLYSPPSEYTNG